MAKFVKVPVEETPPEAADVAEVAELPLWQDPMMHQSLAVLVLAALTTVFVALLLRGLFVRDQKPRTKAAALTGADYSGKGFGKREKPVQKVTLRRQ